jgi:hypothetical protein
MFSDSQLELDGISCEFRKLMTEGQTTEKHNEFRREFYDKVVQIAKENVEKEVCLLFLEYNHQLKLSQKPCGTSPSYMEPVRSNDGRYDFPPAASCWKLVDFLKDRSKKKAKSKEMPVLILAFDEAHILTSIQEHNWSNFSVLRHVLCSLTNFPIFSLFLSTTGKITQFTSRAGDYSERIINGSKKLIQPFTDLGFDVLAQKVSLDGRWKLEDVTKDSHIVTLGRPL